MKISVIVPVYNCADYVERCVRSIMAQTYSNLEIICVDDGSSDGSGNILDALASEDSRICVIHQANGGASAARNTGINNITGEFVTFVDSDDAIEPDMYETLMSLFTDEDIDIAHCGYKRISEDGTVKEVNGTGEVVTQNKFEASNCLLQGSLFVGSMWNKLYRVRLFEDVRLDTTLVINEDVLANAELFTKSRAIVFFDTTKYLFYERTGSVTTATKSYKKLSDCVHAAEMMCRLYKNTPSESAAKSRLIMSQIGLYRWFLMNPAKNRCNEKRQLAKKINNALGCCPTILARQRINFALMYFFPLLYSFTYRLYDRIRTPDWDVKAC